MEMERYGVLMPLLFLFLQANSMLMDRNLPSLCPIIILLRNCLGISFTLIKSIEHDFLVNLNSV